MRIKLLGAFAKIHGYDFLRQLVRPLHELMRTPAYERASFILDPTKVPEEEVLENRRIVQELAMHFLGLVCASHHGLPL